MVQDIYPVLNVASAHESKILQGYVTHGWGSSQVYKKSENKKYFFKNCKTPVAISIILQYLNLHDKMSFYDTML